MKKTKLGTNTNLIRGGLNRSQFNETSEALFLTSGFVYDSAEQAEAIFKGSKKGFQARLPVSREYLLNLSRPELWTKFGSEPTGNYFI